MNAWIYMALGAACAACVGGASAPPSGVTGTGDLGEWFEILNVSNKNLDLNGVTITGKASDTPIVVSTSIPIKPGQAVVFAPSADVTKNGGHTPALTYVQSKFPLSNDADTITINLGNTVIDTVSYDTTAAGKWPFVTPGKALQLSAAKFSAEANDAKDNWCYAAKTFGDKGYFGSPAQPNAVCPTPPVAKAAGVWDWLAWIWAWFGG
ncbi:MAG: lamin tail domain-containing protein [Deltaproteobacteria bacterium]|nr:lamin tail domain-containing protein [Deltaproteobacteria bacterium]